MTYMSAIPLPGMYIDVRTGRINTWTPQSCSEEVLLTICQLNYDGHNISPNLATEANRRGFTPKLLDLINRESTVPNH